jgi:hypothetical protein
MGSRTDTPPARTGGIDICQVPNTEKVYVLMTGYFACGTHPDILDSCR